MVHGRPFMGTSDSRTTSGDTTGSCDRWGGTRGLALKADGEAIR
jgi:hypothetical protein